MSRRLSFVFCVWLMSLAASAQTRFDYFYHEAEKFRLAEDYTTAAELYRHCLDINPQSDGALFNLGLFQIYLREDSLGLASLKRASELAPDNPWYLEMLAAIYLDQRNTDEVIPVLERLASIQKHRSDVLEQLATIYRSKGESQKAVDVLNRIELLEGKSTPLTMTKAELYEEMEQPDRATAELQSLMDEFPHDMNTKVLIGNHYRQKGQMAEAWKLYHEVQQQEPTNGILQLALLDYYQTASDTVRFNHLRDSLLYDDHTPNRLRVALLRDYIGRSQADSTLRPMVTQAFDAVLARPQEDAQILSLKAAYQLYSSVGENEVASTMHQILEVEPGNQTALSWLLKYYAQQNYFPGVEEVCRHGVNYQPEELGYPYYLALALIQQEKKQEAIDVLRQGLRTQEGEADPQLVSDIYSIIGDLYAEQDRIQEAFAAYDSALVYVDDNASVLNNYAYYLSLRGEQLDRAEQMSYRAIRAEADNINYIDTYAWILFMREDYAAARIYADKVVPPDSTDEALLSNEELTGVLLEHAGDIYAQNGQMGEALRYWRLALMKNDEKTSKLLRKKIRRKKYLR